MVDWTDERTALLTKLWSDGFSGAEIADEIGDGTTRNAVIGKVNRLGLAKRHDGIGPRQYVGGRPRKKKSPAPQFKHVKRLRRSNSFTTHLRVVETITSEPPICRLDPDDIPIEQRKQLLDLGANDCRWPYGDVGTPDFFFCGGPKQQGCSYCAGHQRASRGRQARARNPDLVNLQYRLAMRAAREAAVRKVLKTAPFHGTDARAQDHQRGSPK